MNTKNFSTLVGVTAIAVVIAGWVIMSRPATESSDFDGTLVFPDLLDSIDDLDTVVIRHKDGLSTLKVTDSGWAFVERDNYPVQSEKIGELLVKLTRMEKVEPKTKLAEKYDRLDLVDPADKEDTRAKEVVLKNSAGDDIARLMVGKRKFTLGTSEGGTYVLMADDPQAWLVTGELNPGARPRDWLVREISNIKDDDIRRISVVHPDGETLAVNKSTSEQPNYTVEAIPAGMVLKRDSIADDMGRVLSNLLHDDVKKADDFAFPSDTTIKATFEGFAGFTVQVDLIEDGDENWLRFVGTPPDKASDINDENETNWTQVIGDMNAATDGWVYQLPGYEVAAIKKRIADLVKEPEDDGV
ncbi:MAG: DUF4340 domain-containing protein [Rhodospirillaceae bacterium]|jgi:hypothetical protein|nr:DUF4340 domain-containing protein [Rhodospirillaceae bacterium]MBT5241795.1 DUF4340 domain-containing protein [Rhodospirillaceae bacterium]MBT5565201.1 DUF4340 domain-containing protein [Rhodospirillaceae bacterium]MBT6088038.1 DUF4340 domain-containing protein [Rhodospirillaceae bacterium]MBT7449188.1 DUF4340 domain-containing protein [Rhodospirillaceae bacterium]